MNQTEFYYLFSTFTVQTIPMELVRTIPCDWLNRLPKEQKSILADRLVDYFQEKGFPYYVLSEQERLTVLEQMYSFSSPALELPNCELQQNMLGLNLVNSFHPHMWSVPCRDQRTPWEVFFDKKLLKKAILKRIKLSDTALKDFNLRKSLKVFSGVQAVSNFRPTVAKFIYDRYADGYVLDPCAGYSGRLLGAWTSQKVTHYSGVDPCTETLENGWKAVRCLQEDTLTLKKTTFWENLYHSPGAYLWKQPFEDFYTPQKFSLVFTSPPYYDTEKYSEESTQSYLRYPMPAQWRQGFLKPLIEKAHDMLYSKRFLVLNVAETMQDDVITLASPLFGEPVTVWHMRLSLILGNGRKKQESHKYEPILVFQKR